MKTLLYLFFLPTLILSTTFLKAQDTVKDSIKTEIEKRSYAYGAMVAKGIARIGFSKDEKNPDRFVEGLIIGMKGDSASFAEAQKTLQKRMQSKKESTTPEEAGNIAYQLGISLIGGLATVIEIPASDFDFNVFKEAFIASEAGDTLKYEDIEMDSILQAYFTPLSKKYNDIMEAKKIAQSSVNIEAGKIFMEKNSKKEGVITLPSGLQYEIIKEGTGKTPTVADQVQTHYHGTLIDGTVFDSSVERGEPASFGVGQVIKGWQEGIPLMSEGAKYKFYIPQELAYGMQSPSPKIPAGSTLIFEVELLKVIPAPKQNTAPKKVATSPTNAEGVKFLEENSKKKGVITLPSGLQYMVIVKGDGPKPKLTDKVQTHYHGTLIDGTVFDSSVERGEPATFPVNQVIKGWQEGIPLMSEGAKYRLFIPQNLAYGMRATGKIPAGSTLIFDVELIKINP